MKCFGIDLETNGLESTNCAIVEVGYALWEEKSKILFSGSVLVDDTAAPNYDQNWDLCEKTSKISRDQVLQCGYDGQSVCKLLTQYIQMSDVVIAANGEKFDHPVLEAFFQRYQTDFPKTPWIDLYDFPFPSDCQHRNLLYLAAYYGFVNPFPHRAITDVFTMMKIIENFDVAETLEKRKIPKIQLIAQVSYNDRDKAKLAGFKWDPNRKVWFLTIPEPKVEEFIKSLPFKVKEVNL